MMKKDSVVLLTSLCVLESVSLAQASSVEGTSFNELKEEARAAVEKKDYVLAEDNFSQAKEVALESNDQAAIFDMDMRRAAQYIHSNEPSRAEIILRPYVKPGANKFILSDYMMALRACNQPDKVLEIYNTCVTDKENFPAYGTQVVGDVLLRQGKFKEAAEIYSKILAKEKVENVPFVQLGYSYCLAKLNRKEESVAAYKKVADLNVERYNNIICMDCDALLAAGRVNTARKIMSLLAENNEKYQLRYAKGLVNVGVDYEEKSSNFRRDEILLGRDYKHEAEKILRKLERSNDENIAQEARILRAENFLQNELYDDSKKKIEEALSKDSKTIAAQAVLNDYESTKFNDLSIYYMHSLDNKRNSVRTLGTSYDTYIGNNFFLGASVNHKWYKDDDVCESIWQNSIGLTKKFENVELKAEWYNYLNADTKNGFGFGIDYDFNDVTKLSYSFGRRLLEQAPAIQDNVKENFHEIMLTHHLNHLTDLTFNYDRSKMSDDNRYQSYGLSFNHLLRVKHNFSDRVNLWYEHTKYDKEANYDSPWRRDEYGAVFSRKWNLLKQNATFELKTGLNFGRDNDEKTSFMPMIGINYVREFIHDQQLVVAMSYSRYYNQTNPSKRKDGLNMSVSYNWRW